MNWSAHHKQSEMYASEAELAVKNGEHDQATRFYRLAAESENLALSSLASNKPRTLGIIAVSVAALWYKAGAFEQTIQTAEKWLKNHELPPFAINQLQELLLESKNISSPTVNISTTTTILSKEAASSAKTFSLKIRISSFLVEIVVNFRRFAQALRRIQ
jgi:hypothetical protein